MSRYDEGCGGGSVLFSFILGAIIGAGVAAFLTPTTGPENRRRFSDLKDDLMEKSSDLRDEAREKYREARENVDETINTGKDFIDKQKGILSTAIEAGREAYNREKESGTAEES